MEIRIWWFTCTIFYVFLLSVTEGEAMISIKVVSGAENFVEDKKTTFSCHVSKPVRNDEVVWMIENPKNRQKIFYTYSLRDESQPTKLDERKEAKFDLVMRRDFSYMDIVCRTTKGNEKAHLRLPEINKTIEIEDVKFRAPVLIHGQYLRFFCDVKAKPGIVKFVDFRDASSMAMSTDIDIKKQTSDFTPYVLQSHMYIDVKNHDGKYVQCFAAKDGFKRPTGNVMSPFERITVYYFKPQNPKLTEMKVPEGDAAAVDFKLSCNPKPRKEQFSVRSNESTAEIDKLSIEEPNASGKYEYNVKIEFKPTLSGRYRIDFKSQALAQAKTTVMTADVILDSHRDILHSEQKIPVIYLVLVGPVVLVSSLFITIFFIKKRKKQPLNCLKLPARNRKETEEEIHETQDELLKKCAV